MIAKYESKKYENNLKVWIKKYENLENALHWHNETEIIYINSGSAVININNRQYIAETGTVFLCPAGEIHCINSKDNCVCTIIMFDESELLPISDEFSISSPALCGKYDINMYYNLLKKELDNKKILYTYKIKSILTDLLTDIYRTEEIIKKIPAKNKSITTRYQRLLTEIDKNFAEITFDYAASFMGFTRPYFSKIFYKLSGMTFTRYVNIVKIENAVKILKTSDYTVTHTALLCGFNSIRNFNRVFKSITGITPSQITPDFELNITPLKAINESFDPTFPSSILISDE